MDHPCTLSEPTAHIHTYIDTIADIPVALATRCRRRFPRLYRRWSRSSDREDAGAHADRGLSLAAPRRAAISMRRAEIHSADERYIGEQVRASPPSGVSTHHCIRERHCQKTSYCIV